MKRIALLTLIMIFVVLNLTSCIVIPRTKNFEIDADDVESIDIYCLCNTDSLYSHFIDKVKPVYEISSEKCSDFLSDLAEIEFSDPIVIIIFAAVDKSFYYDTWTIRINYKNGSYELISCGGFGETFDKNGKALEWHHFGCEKDVWDKFIEKHVPVNSISHSH